MESELSDAMAAGVFVEFCDTHGNSVGQAVFTDWNGRAVPGMGDLICCPATLPATGRREKLAGRVLKRQFELQHDTDGQTCVWVRLLVETIPASVPGWPRKSARFSAN